MPDSTARCGGAPKFVSFVYARAASYTSSYNWFGIICCTAVTAGIDQHTLDLVGMYIAVSYIPQRLVYSKRAFTWCDAGSTRYHIFALLASNTYY